MMTFLFRPAVEYAMHTKKRCFDIARSMKSRVIHQVFDGFLLRIIRQGKRTIANVIDAPGDFYVAGFEVVQHFAEGDIAYNTYDGRLGYYLRSGEGEPYAGNMTYALVKPEDVSYSGFLYTSFNAPSEYLSTSGRPPRTFFSAVEYDLPVSGAYAAYVVGGADEILLDTPTEEFFLFRVFPYGKTSDQFWNYQEPEPIEPGALNWRVLHLHADDFLGAQTPPYPKQNDLVCSIYSNTIVYVVGKREYGFVSPPGIGLLAWKPEAALVTASRVVISSVGEGDETQTVTEIQRFGQFTAADLLPEDQPQQVTWEKSDLAASFDFVRINGDYSPYSDTSQYITNPGYSGTSGPSLSFGTAQNINSVYSTGVSAYSVPRMGCIGFADGVDFLFTIQSSRTVADTNSTWRYRVGLDDWVESDFSYPEVPSTYGVITATEGVHLNHTALYLVRFHLDGSKTVRCLHRQTYAVHDPQYRDSRHVQYTPVFNTLLLDGEAERTCFFCIRTDSPKYVSVLSPTSTAIRDSISPAADEVDLVMVFGDGTVTQVQLGNLYPVFFYLVDNRVADTNDDSIDGITRRPGYGWAGRTETWSTTARYPRITPLPVCLYAPGMAAAIVAPRAGYADTQQIAKLVVFRISDGSIVAESEFELPFEVEITPGLESVPSRLVQWSVTCIEQGAVDEDGNLVRYAKLLLSEIVLGNPSAVYRADDLTTLHTIGVWGAIGQAYLRGPVYYVGSALAPVVVGKSTFRSFLTGNPVPDS